MPHCEFCSRYFRDGYNLERHCNKFHNEGYDDPIDEEVETEQDSGEENESDREEEEEEEGGGDSNKDDYDQAFGPLLENVFDRFEDERKLLIDDFIEKGDSRITASHKAHQSLTKKYQKALREELRTNLQHWSHMKIHPTYKEIMKTVKSLRDDDFDIDESIDAAISQRKHLINRIVPTEPMDIAEEDNSDG